jgi:hypothetical protein
MTLALPAVSAAQPSLRTAPSTACRHQNEILSDLLHRCAEQDEAALARLYDLTSPWIYALVTRHSTSTSAADGAMVAIYSKVWRQAARHAEHDQSILAWMTTLACQETASGTDASR